MACLNHPDVLSGLADCSRCGKAFCQDCIIRLRGAILCGRCKDGAIIDAKSGNFDSETLIDLASCGARFSAAFVDWVVICVVVRLAFFAVSRLHVFRLLFALRRNDPFFLGLMAIGILVVFGICYEGLMLALWGRTLGKMATRTKVVTPEGGPITTGQAWFRASCRGFLILLLYIGPIIDSLFIFSKTRATLHDRMAKTRVVRMGG